MTVQFCCLARNQAEIQPLAPSFVFYSPNLSRGIQNAARAQVLLGAEAEATASALLGAGAGKVFVGEAALRDAALMDRLMARFGAARVGLHVPVQRQAVSWSFDRESNADFSVVTPSLCAPAWEVLLADGRPSGILATSWMQEMLRRGVQSVLVRADIRDDADLNLCAGMVEMLGDKLWLAPLNDPAPPIGDWVRYGQATQLALPMALYRRRAQFLADASRTDPALAVVEAQT